MGAGEYEAGMGPAGLDPLPDATNPPARTYPVALRFDGATKDFPLDEDGIYASVGTGAQKVELALLRAFDKMPIAKTEGLDMKGVDPMPGAKLDADVDTRVRRAIAAPLAAREIELLSIAASVPTRGGIKIYVRFKDLTDPLRPVIQITVG